jgi:membrane fusion protein, multidrug efflux system
MTKNKYFILLLPLLIFSCKRANGKNKNKTVKMPDPMVKVMKVTYEKFTPIIDSIGIAQANRKVLLSVERPGKLVYLPYEVGNFVQKKKLVARVRSLGLWSQRSQAKSRINEVQNALIQARRDFTKVKALRKSGVVSEHDFELADLQLKTRKAQLNNAKAGLSQIHETLYGTNVFANFSGIVSVKFVEVGTFVNMGTPLVQMVDLSKVKVKIGVSELEIKHIKVGHRVKIRAIAYPKVTYEGYVNSISPISDAQTGSFPVEVIFDNIIDKTSILQMAPEKSIKKPVSKEKIKIDNTPRGPWKIKGGMTLKVKFNKTSVSGIFIPSDGVLDRTHKKWVVIINENSKTEDSYNVIFREVKIGKSFEGWYEIISGLKTGDKIIIAGNTKLRKDSKVRIKEISKNITSDIYGKWNNKTENIKINTKTNSLEVIKKIDSSVRKIQIKKNMVKTVKKPVVKIVKKPVMKIVKKSVVIKKQISKKVIKN